MRIIADTGILVALLDRRDQHHQWANVIAKQYKAPFYTCEAVIAEAAHLLSGKVGALGVIRLIDFLESELVKIDFLESELVKIDFRIENHTSRIAALLQRYENVPMDYADACIVVMAEQEKYREHIILTVDDNDFRIYRRNGREALTINTPQSR